MVSLLLIGDLDALRVRRETVPSQCRANDGTERVGRYHRRMEQWVPLFVAVVGAVAAVSVAFWNSRGESAELRQLKAMNEVIAGLSDFPSGMSQFTEARNDLLMRVARRVKSAPKRRNAAVGIAAGVVVVAFAAWAFATYVPTLTTEQASTLAQVLVIVVSLAGLAMGWLGMDAAKAASNRARRLTAREGADDD
ncbi:hypothetical protein KZC52_16755 [Microbacterium sp. kSW2-24]|uniref:hypothetical protein n=1 Tax=Microbacterium galbinum TaxID=2851646 RepID=UPI001FFCF299|nr:hypothetical protein [Microbacterium galbinum]MCK2024580.1 hypothetical protein [Microbacterium galbinum]